MSQASHSHLIEVLGRFRSVGLSDITSVNRHMKLLRRHDTKFVFKREKLETLLGQLDGYSVLDIDDRRIFDYENLYFDTDDLMFYLQHHNGKLCRYKLRYRRYVDSDLKYWEVKIKKNKTKTVKKRFEQEDEIVRLTDEIKDSTRGVLPAHHGIDFDRVEPRLWINFKRITLIDAKLGERATIDMNISYRSVEGRECRLDDIVVAELKQATISMRSPFVQEARRLGIYPKRFSKYCTGIIMMGEPVKKGRFKGRMLGLDKINAA